MMTFQEIIESIETLPVEDQDYLFDLIRKRRIEHRRAEILANAQAAIQAVKDGTAKRGSVQDLIADLLGDDDGSCLE
jgi:vacuolar-type H+-ATPase subunit H